MKNTNLIFIVIALVVVGLIVFPTNMNGNVVSGNPAKMYKSASCGCCVKYAPYFESYDFNLDVNSIQDMGQIKRQYNIPADMESCHTILIGDYFVEGHVPIEAINKLLNEKPDIDGISLPGMPSGSPGMPGVKHGEWIIYAIKEGVSSEFMRI